MPVSTNHHSALSAPATVADFNVGLGELDYAITQTDASVGDAETDITTLQGQVTTLQGQVTTLLAESGLILLVTTAGEDLTANDTAYLNLTDSKIYEMDADAAPAQAGVIRGFVLESVLTDASAMLVVGGRLDGFTGLTPGLPVFVDTTGAGTITQERPKPTLDSGQLAIISMGMAVSATEVDVLPGYLDNRIRYQARYSPAQDETVTIQHHNNANGFGRVMTAYVTGENALAEYGSANQDSDVNLRDRPIATYTADQCSGGTPLGNMVNGGSLAAAFDNDAGSAARRLSNSSGTIGYDFGSNKTIRQYTLTEVTSQPSGEMAQNWTFEHSSNGSDWTVIDTVSGETGWGDGEKRTFSVDTAVAARYWRVNITNNNGGSNLSIGEVEMMEAATYTDGADALAQGFEVSSDSNVATVRLWLKKVGSPTGNLTVKIETDNAGDPSGTVVTNGTSDTVAASSLSSSYGWIDFTFSTNPSLTGSTQYHIVLETTDSVDEFDYVVWGADGSTPGYANGELQSETSSVWSSESADAVFEVSAEGLQYLNQVSVDYWDSTHADMVNKAGDSGGADVNTRTTFKCTKAAGFADITVEVVI